MSEAEQAKLLQPETKALVEWAAVVQAGTEPFLAAQQLARALGAHWERDKPDCATFGFWVPDLTEAGIPDDQIYLELYTPLEPLLFSEEESLARFRRDRIQMQRGGAYAWAVIAGLQAGTRTQAGSFYWLVWEDPEGNRQVVRDPLAHSVPFGATGPAELYDMHRMFAGRRDAGYFSKLDTAPEYGLGEIPRIAGPANLLQLHVNTASPEGTFKGLTHIYRRIAEKLEACEELTLAEQNFTEYDAVQLMPVEPIIEFEEGPGFWQPVKDADDIVTVQLTRPHMTNWGYDVMTVASPAPSPTTLETLRPDEFLRFIETLHNFPSGPIKIVLDVVYGHADNQALPLLNRRFFAGPGMYGQNLNYRHPVVRAVLLEMQRRKSNYGIDGLRVDGAQDFKYWDAEAQILRHDDHYLQLMNDLVQEAAGQPYLPWMIFEDGRPWPQADWEISSSYREVTRRLPNVVQWGPLTFAHNTPFLFTFWISKWWRIREIARHGSHWITGCANHDTMRRGTQVDPEARINTNLGDTLPEILRKAYDNPAARLFDYAMMPGIPMEFISATMHAPWSFIRNTDDRWAVKVASDEARFLDWAVTPEEYTKPENFSRLKELGFQTYDRLYRFMHALACTVPLVEGDLEKVVDQLCALRPRISERELSVQVLKRIARAWMDDVHAYCNVWRWTEQLEEAQVAFNRNARRFRRERPWLRDNLRTGDILGYLEPMLGTVLFYGLRHAPDGAEQILFLANMEGATRSVDLQALPIDGPAGEGWSPALVTPGLVVPATATALTVGDSEGVVLVRPLG